MSAPGEILYVMFLSTSSPEQEITNNEVHCKVMFEPFLFWSNRVPSPFLQHQE